MMRRGNVKRACQGRVERICQELMSRGGVDSVC